MAFTYGFYNYSENDDPSDLKVYDAVQVSQIFDGILTDGIISGYGDAFRVTTSSTTENVAVVKSGRAWFNHTWNYNDSDLQLSSLAEPIGYPRTDAVIIDIDNDTRHNEIKWVQGPADDPSYSKPTLINTSTHRQVPLAFIRRTPGDNGRIYGGNIEDARGVSFYGLGLLCPYSKPVTEIFTVDTIISQWLNAMTDWEDSKKAEFTSWFSNLRANLDSDVATNLQDQIDTMIRGTVEQSVTLSNSSDTIVDFHSIYIDDYAYFDVAAEITDNLPYVSYKKIEVFQDVPDPYVRVTFSRYTGPLTTPPTFRARLYMR